MDLGTALISEPCDVTGETTATVTVVRPGTVTIINDNHTQHDGLRLHLQQSGLHADQRSIDDDHDGAARVVPGR